MTSAVRVLDVVLMGRLERSSWLGPYRRADKRAAIVFFFGGGWVGGTPQQFYPHCKYLASRGTVAMSAPSRAASIT